MRRGHKKTEVTEKRLGKAFGAVLWVRTVNDSDTDRYAL
jgi:hypothetical protein